jgi:hypothetical protein
MVSSQEEIVVTIPVDEIIKIVNEYSQLVLEIEGEATTEGTRAEQYTDTGKDHQRWRLKPAGPGNENFYNIENVHSTMSLEVVGYGKEPGAEIVQRPYGDGPLHRQWKLVPVAGKTDVYKIENRNSGLVLDDVGGQKDAPAPVKQYESWNDDGRQQWQLTLVPTPAPPTPTPAPPTLRTGQIIALRADNGMYLSRISRPGKEPIEAAKSALDIFCQFTVTTLANGQIALQADTGKYLSRISRPNMEPIEAAKSALDIFSQFTVTTLANGQIALQADTGKYLSRISRPNMEPIEAAKNALDIFCQFTLVTFN